MSLFDVTLNDYRIYFIDDATFKVSGPDENISRQIGEKFFAGLREKESGMSAGILLGSNVTNPMFAVGLGAIISTYTVPGVIAHESALKGGELMKIPQFDEAKT